MKTIQSKEFEEVTMIRFSQCSAPLLLATCICLLGCSPGVPMGTVEGTVTFNGNSYSDASVVFLSLQNGAGSSADIQSDGSFVLPDPLPTGTYKVFLAPRSIPEDEAGEPTAVYMDKSVPEKFWNESTTDVSVEVKDGENTIPVEFKS